MLDGKLEIGWSKLRGATGKRGGWRGYGEATRAGEIWDMDVKPLLTGVSGSSVCGGVVSHGKSV